MIDHEQPRRRPFPPAWREEFDGIKPIRLIAYRKLDRLSPDTRYFADGQNGQPGEKRGQAYPRDRHSYGGGDHDHGFSGGCPHSIINAAYALASALPAAWRKIWRPKFVAVSANALRPNRPSSARPIFVAIPPPMTKPAPAAIAR
jgi:hypothetical protein